MLALPVVFILIILSFSRSLSWNIYYVIPTDVPFANCPADEACMTLELYAKLNNFTAGMKLMFLPGNHSLSNSTLTLANVSDITLNGEQLATIICTNRITIECKNVTNLKIEGLLFLRNYTDEHRQQISVIRLINSYEAVLSNTTFKDVGSIKAKSLILECSKMTIIESTFKGNIGGVIYAFAGTTLSITGSHFTKNTGSNDGGAIEVSNSNLLLDGNPPNVFTHNSARYCGGAISCFICNLTMCGTNTFYNHSALYSRHYLARSGGGTLYVNRGKLMVSGIMHISHSRAAIGGALKLFDSQAYLNGTSIIFQENRATDDGGGVSIEMSSFVSHTENLTFINNIADGTGGAIKADNYRETSEVERNAERVVLSGCFINNTGTGAIYAKSVQMTFSNIRMINNSNTALSISSSNVTFNGNTRIIRNSNGGMIADHSLLIFEDIVLFDSNSAPNGGALNCLQGTLTLSGHILFTSNRADNDGGAVYAVGTLIYMRDVVNFTFNKANRNGGAMFFETGASITLKMFPVDWHGQYSKLNSMNNYAEVYGGGIYHVDSPTTRQCYQRSTYEDFLKLPYCFLQAEGTTDEYEGYLSIEINSYNDTAGRDGNFLYGGLLNRCRFKSEDWESGKRFFLDDHKIININSTTTKVKEITSKPYQLCFCDDNEKYPDNCKKTLTVEVLRGQKFTLSLLATAQVGTTFTQVTAITSANAKLEINQTSQYLPDRCNSLPYTLYSKESHEEVILYPDGPCRDTGLASVVINATILPCPDGFTQMDEVCICDKRLYKYNVSCTIANVSYIAKAADTMLWLGALYAYESYEGLIIGSPCPKEYCKRDAVDITLDNLDIQCDLQHGGLLCGECAASHSLMLGGSKCQVCSNTYLALLLPFAAAGIALVVFLTSLRLTVAIGSLNSVILYANILQVNRSLLFPANTRNILTIFLAWMNLDLGIQTCFYDGLDAYAQTWFQFAFPLYVWLLIGMIIIMSRYSITVSKLIGHNPIAVTATLILMSYTKLLKIIIEVYSSVDLEYPGNKTVTVWLKDANVPYLQTRHLLLTIVTTLVLIFFFLPYTLLLVFGFKLYYFSGVKFFRWIINIKPFLDSYYAPYYIRTRYWIGLLLLVRCVLYVVFLTKAISTSKSFFTINITFTILLCAMGVLYSGKVYKIFYNNLVEVSIYLNLILLSAAELAGISSKTLVYVLVALVFITTICISAYQFHLQYVVKMTLWLKVKEKWLHYRKASREDPQIRNDPQPSYYSHKIITKAVMELREPVMED